MSICRNCRYLPPVPWKKGEKHYCYAKWVVISSENVDDALNCDRYKERGA